MFSNLHSIALAFNLHTCWRLILPKSCRRGLKGCLYLFFHFLFRNAGCLAPCYLSCFECWHLPTCLTFPALQAQASPVLSQQTSGGSGPLVTCIEISCHPQDNTTCTCRTFSFVWLLHILPNQAASSTWTGPLSRAEKPYSLVPAQRLRLEADTQQLLLWMTSLLKRCSSSTHFTAHYPNCSPTR